MCPHFIQTPLSTFLVLLVGVLWGLGGPRAGVLLLPIFVLVLGILPDLAVVAAVAVVGMVALFDAWEEGAKALPRSPLDVSRLLLAMALTGFGAFLVHLVPGQLYMWMMGIPLVGWGVVSIVFATKRVIPEQEGRETGIEGIGKWSIRAFSLGFLGAPSGSKGIPGIPLWWALMSGAAMFVFWREGAFRWNAALPALVAMMVGIELGKPLARKVSDRIGGIIVGAMMVGASLATVAFMAMGS